MKPLRFFLPPHALVAVLILNSMGALTVTKSLAIVFVIGMAASLYLTIATPEEDTSNA